MKHDVYLNVRKVINIFKFKKRVDTNELLILNYRLA